MIIIFLLVYEGKLKSCILLNIMFHVLMGRFQLELYYYFTYFSPSSHLALVCFFPVCLSLLIQHFQQVLWVLKFLLSSGLVLNSNYQLPKPGDRRNFNPTVNCPSQETEVSSTPTRPVENVVLTTKGIQDRNNNC